MDLDGLFGPGMYGRGAGDGADMVSRMNIVAESERDLQRQRERDAEPVQPMRWRYHDGSWQRWSDLDRAFVTRQPPPSLLEHAAATGGPVDDEELVYDGDSWEPADDLAEEAAATAAHDTPDVPAVPAVDPWADTTPPPPPPPATAAPAQDAADFQAQIEAWRNRR